MNRPSPSRFSRFSPLGLGAELAEPSPDPRRVALPSGSRLAEYRILSVLDQGISGFRYLAMDHGLQRPVVIEEYLPAGLARRGSGPAVIQPSDQHTEAFAQGLEAFIDQARLLARFDHPSLMRVYRFWEANRTAYLATPCYEGIRLGDARLAMDRPPDENWLHELLLPLLDALEVLHGAACYHWDISPENILLLPDGWPVVLSYADSRGTRHDQAFAPIESHAQSAALPPGPWTSLYSLAALTYHCISGQPPPASTVRALDDRMEPLFQVVDRLGRSFPELNYSVAFVSTIERALNIRPEERPRSLDEFRRALLGGAGPQESGAMQAAESEGKQQERPSLLRSSRDETASRPPSAARREEPTLRPDPAQGSPTWFVPPTEAARTSEEYRGTEALPTPDGFPDSGDFHGLLQAETDGSLEGRGRGRPGHDARTERGQRVWLAGFATLTFCVFAVTGWMFWSDYREAKAEQRFLALSPEQPPATPPDLTSGTRPRMLAEPQPEPLAPAPPASALEPQPTPSPIALSEAAPAGLRLENQARVANAPATAAENNSSAGADDASRASSPGRRVRNAPDNPRTQCGTRTQFSLYRCMKDVCESAKYYEHAECKHLRVMDEVRASP